MSRKLLLTEEELEYLDDKTLNFLYRTRIYGHIFALIVIIVLAMDLGLRLANK